MAGGAGLVRFPGGDGVQPDPDPVATPQRVAVVHNCHVALERSAAGRRRRLSRQRCCGAEGFWPDLQARPVQGGEEGDDRDKRRRDQEALVTA